MCMCVCVCVWYTHIFVSVCVNLSSLPLKQPKSAQTDIFTLLSELLFFFFSFPFDVYLQAENQGLSYCMFTFHLFIVNTGKRGGRGAKIKMHTDLFRDSQAEWLLF